MNSTLADVEFETGRLVHRFHLGSTTNIHYGGPMADTQALTDTQLSAELESTEETFLRRLGGRKFGLAVLVLLLATLLLWFGKIPPDVWQWVSIVAVTGYAGLNVAQQVARK